MNKEERIEISVSSNDKQVFKKAQELSGDKTFSGFITRVLKKYSEQIIEENEKILLSKKDREIFFDAVFADLEPNEKLKQAAKAYKKQFEAQ